MAAGGIAIPAGIQAAELFGIAAIRVYESGQSGTRSVSPTAAPWRPPSWSQPAMYMITVPGAYTTILGASSATSQVGQTPDDNNTITTTVTASQVPVTQPPTYLVFDGVIRASHSQPARPTSYPVQTQANFSDHVLLEQARLTLDIVMSDAQQSYASGQWVGNPSKSISCFQVLDTLRAARVPLTVATRLKTYYNMVLLDVVPEESVKTLHGLKARVEFKQVFIATVSSTQTNGTSARQQTTDSSELGPTNTTPVTPGVSAQNGLPSSATGAPSSAALQKSTGQVQGAGNWSSNNASYLNPSYLTQIY